MANTKSAKRAARVSERHGLRNRAVKSSVRTHISKARDIIGEGDAPEAQGAMRGAIIALDRAARKGVIHPNNAARRKSRLVKQLNAALEQPQS
ncbi:MAG: 30S ribosomal protein S20 [Chloroflexi bacterium]|nr:30S ribosomal protein S20 [Chloroflexota bacterium]